MSEPLTTKCNECSEPAIDGVITSDGKFLCVSCRAGIRAAQIPSYPGWPDTGIKPMRIVEFEMEIARLRLQVTGLQVAWTEAVEARRVYQTESRLLRTVLWTLNKESAELETWLSEDGQSLYGRIEDSTLPAPIDFRVPKPDA